MFELSDFYDYCRGNRVDVIPYNGMPAQGATIRDGEDMAIFLDFTRITSLRQLRAVCMHEQGHAATGALHKVSSPYETVERSEYRAKRWTAERYLTAKEFQSAIDAGCRELWELSEYFDLPEAEVAEALRYWTECRGVRFTAADI